MSLCLFLIGPVFPSPARAARPPTKAVSEYEALYADAMPATDLSVFVVTAAL